MAKFIVAPSILTANFLDLKSDLDKLEKVKIKWIHYDVMDYNFVPNLSFGPKILTDIVASYNFKMDLHLMVKIENISVEQYLKPFLVKNVKQITIHFEALTEKQIEDFLKFCANNNIIPSISINPDTDVKSIEKYLSKIGNVLIMSVYPGFGGQSFIASSLEKIKKLRELKNKHKYIYSIQVDGGINDDTYKLVQNAGVDMIVAGSYLVGPNVENLMERVTKLEG
ncbi:ribulose-phosphate 3-epimerase [Spiroplasma cantharicola]|uniref:Ribulose-phosphate 3-epimerase n=1 Tax=Spiroplasma cantharicola TaxID=362837 RepID=A0A0M5KEH2_9MOLU|nr:ribulose-phosphate 3-epimerase [Spiroplasma cantharicola]ALD66743.1 ribulose-phosphate 3-epimerase [Spiroplasma cantharicola]